MAPVLRRLGDGVERVQGTPPAGPLTDVRQFLDTLPEGAGYRRHLAEFGRLGALTALRHAAGGEFYISNPYRAYLLYSLVHRHRPRGILEIGTGRGYGALSMAMAAAHAGLGTEIFTLDMTPPQMRQPWPIEDEIGQRVERLSVQEVWARLPPEWTGRVHQLTGSSVAVMKRWLADPGSPPIDFVFVDGGHDYWTARHDVLASLLAGRGASVTLVLDDYGGVQGQEIRDFVERVLAPAYPNEAVHRLVMPQTEAEREESGAHGMVYLDGGAARITAEAWLRGWSPTVAMTAHRWAATAAGRVRGARARARSALRLARRPHR